MHCCMDVVCTVVWMWYALVYALFCMPCCRLCMWYALLYALLLTSSRREDGFSCRHGFKPPLTHCVCCMPCCMSYALLYALYVCCMPCCMYVVCPDVCMLYALLYALYVCCMPCCMYVVCTVVCPDVCMRYALLYACWDRDLWSALAPDTMLYSTLLHTSPSNHRVKMIIILGCVSQPLSCVKFVVNCPITTKAFHNPCRALKSLRRCR